MAKIFITGTGTEVGKTIVSGILAVHSSYSYWKPIQSGASRGTDSDQVKNLSPSTHIIPEAYKLNAFLSPDQAAILENQYINIQNIPHPQQSNILIEGAGGIYTPLNEKERIIDLIPKIADGCIIVASSSLGTITPTLLTIEALQTHNIPIYGLILNGSLNRMNRKSITNYTNVKIVGCLPKIENLSHQYVITYTKKYFTNELRNELKF